MSAQRKPVWAGAKAEEIVVEERSYGYLVACPNNVYATADSRQNAEFFAEAIRADIRRRNGNSDEALAKVTAERDELLAACEAEIERHDREDSVSDDEHDALRAIIDRVKGGA